MTFVRRGEEHGGIARRLYLLVLALLGSGLIAIGCGGDGEGNGGSGEATQTQESSGDGIDRAKRRCKEELERQPHVDEELTADLHELCDQLENPKDLARIAEEICARNIEKATPPGPAREAALQACSPAGRAP